jgi:hypothetical protein
MEQSTSNRRIDTVQRHYDDARAINIYTVALFWITVVSSFLILLLQKNDQMTQLINTLFIISTFLYFISNSYLYLISRRKAEETRRTHLLTNSFGVKLDDEETNKYYNNTENPSIYRLGINVCENSLFTSTVLAEMLKVERIKVLFYIIAWFLVLLTRDIKLEYIAVIAQTLFTSSIITGLLKMEIYNKTCREIFSSLRNIFYFNQDKNSPLTTAKIINEAFKYECIKAAMSIFTSTKIFNKINPKTTVEWERIKSNIGL